MQDLVMEDRQGPTTGKVAQSYGTLLGIVSHPAFRLGFLDAQHGRDFDHDRIMLRIVNETPTRALERIGWSWAAAPERLTRDLFSASHDRKTRALEVELAQYRYEEGRLAVLDLGLRCRAWGHPDFPPKAVDDYIWERASRHMSDPLKLPDPVK